MYLGVYKDTIKMVFKFAMSVDKDIQKGLRITRELFNGSDNISKKKVSKKTIKATIVSYLRNNPKATYLEIGNEIEIRNATKYLSGLVNAGIIEVDLGKPIDAVSMLMHCVQSVMV